MTLGLERVIYMSTPTRPDPALVALAELLSVSDRNNRRRDLTGALLVSEDRFVQVLEGARQDLDRLMATLALDRRHRDLTVLDRRPIATRRFGGWTMVAARITPSERPRMEAVVELCATEPDQAAERMRDLVERQLA